jgi:PAS domain S-box-containing protein
MEEQKIKNKPGRSEHTKKAAQALAIPFIKHTALLQEIFDSAPEALILTDRNGRIRFMNTMAISMLGKPDGDFSPEEWPEKFGLYLNDGMTLYPSDKLPLTRALHGKTIPVEEMILRKEREVEEIWISMSAAPILGGEGIRVLIQNVSDRKQIEISRERQIQRIETLYKLSRALTEAGNNLDRITQTVVKLVAEVVRDVCSISLLDTTGEKLTIAAFYDTNPTGQALLRKLLDESTEQDREKSLSGRVIKTGEPLLIPSIPIEQLQAVTQTELKEYVEQIGIKSVLVVPLKGRSGILGAISLARHRDREAYNLADRSFLMDIASRTSLAIENCRLFDSLRAEITERRYVEQELITSEQRFRSIFESTALGIKVLDLNGNILQTNSAFRKMLGYKEEEMIGRHFTDFIHSEDIPHSSRLFKHLINNRAPYFRFEHRIINCEKAVLWVKSIFTVVKKGELGDDLAFIVGMVENITEQKRLELEMNELKSRLQGSMELERLRLAQELHDNPMQTLYSAIYRIEELRKAADPEMDQALTDVNLDIQKVLRDLRITAKELRPPSIFNFGLENAIRSHVDDILEKHPGLQIHLSLAHDRQILPEKVRLALFRVFQQAVANVIRHAEATEMDVHFSFDVEQAYLVVSDNGKGFEVPANWIELVRDGHYGLAGASERVSALGGTFAIESQPGNSTTIRVAVPWMESME